MTITSTNYTSLQYIEEVTPGVTPTSPTFDPLPTTGGSPMSNLATAVSEVIRSDRQTDDLVLVDSEVAGSVNFELSYDPYKPILANIMRNTAVSISWTDSGGGSGASNGSSTLTTTGDFTTETDFATGQLIYAVFGTTTANNGWYRITGAVTTSAIPVYPAPPSDCSSENLTITATVYTNGAEVPTTYSFLKMVEGIASTAYFYYKGCVVSNMALNFETGSILNGSFDILGREEDVTETAYSGQTINSVPAYTIMNAVSSIANIDLAGLTASSCFSTMNLSINNNSTAAKCIGTLGASDIADFGFEVTADINMYFESIAVYEKFIAADSFSVTFDLVDGDGNRIAVYMPNCKFETLEVPIDGKDNFLMQSGSFRALRDSTLDFTLEVSFYDAP